MNWWARFRSRLKAKRPFKLTPAGWVFILYTIGVGAGAINTGNNLLYLIFGVFLGLILASGVLSDLSLWQLDVSWKFPICGEQKLPIVIPVHIQNRKRWFSALSVVVELEGRFRGEVKTIRTHIPFVAAGKSAVGHVVFESDQRGVFDLTAVRVSTRYPFALLKKWWTLWKVEFNEPESFFVLPATHGIDNLSTVLPASRLQLTALSDAKGDGPTVFGVKEFRPGDNPRRIHWKASAKRNDARAQNPSWLVREMEKEQTSEFFLVLPPPERAVASSRLEAQIELAASLLKASEAEGRFMRIRVGDNVVSKETAGGLSPEWEFLALYGTGPEILSRLNKYLIPMTKEEWERSDQSIDIDSFFDSQSKGAAA